MSQDAAPATPGTLEEATRIAQEQAREYGEEHYVTEWLYSYEQLLHFHPERRDPVAFSWCPASALGVVITEVGDTADWNGAPPFTSWTILRVASPDGRVAAVTDPGTRAGRLAAFCGGE